MIEQVNGWGHQLVDRPIEFKRCRARRKSADGGRWRVDHDLPAFIRASAEDETSWRLINIESILDSSVDQYDDAMLRLREAARVGDERAFLQAVQKIRWRGLSAANFVDVIRLALKAGAYRAARDITQKGSKYHPDDMRIREYARVLAPARVISSGPASEGARRRSNREWLEAHGAEYSGQWLAIRDGKLLGASDSLESLVERLGGTEDVLLTIP